MSGTGIAGAQDQITAAERGGQKCYICDLEFSVSSTMAFILSGVGLIQLCSKPECREAFDKEALMSYQTLIRESEDRMRALIAEQKQSLETHIAGLNESNAETDAEKLAELEALFDLRHNADMRAIKCWQEATGRDLIWPDQADLCVWLLEQLDKTRALLQPFADAVFNDNGEMTITPRHGAEAYYAAYWAMKYRK